MTLELKKGWETVIERHLMKIMGCKETTSIVLTLEKKNGRTDGWRRSLVMN